MVTVDIWIGCLSSVVLFSLQRPRLVSKPLWGLVWQNRCHHWVWWRYLLELAVDIDDLPVLHWGQLRNQNTTELSHQLSLLPQWVLPTVSMWLVWWPPFLLGVLVPCPPLVVLCMGQNTGLVEGLSVSVASAWLQHPRLLVKTEENRLSISSVWSLIALWVSDFDTLLQTKLSGMSRRPSGSIKSIPKRLCWEFKMYMITDTVFSSILIVAGSSLIIWV